MARSGKEPVSNNHDTQFRQWLNEVMKKTQDAKNVPRTLSEWEKVYSLERKRDISYVSEVFKNRDFHRNKAREGSEDFYTYQLYHECWSRRRCLLLAGEACWLLGYQWPCQERRKKQRADLVGVKPNGGFVVFECKRGDNVNDVPLAALLEGLDYLCCLTGRSNWNKILNGFEHWERKYDPPACFNGCTPMADIPPSVVVLAPRKYYQRFSGRKNLDNAWPAFMRGRAQGKCLELGYAVWEPGSLEAEWLDVKDD